MHTSKGWSGCLLLTVLALLLLVGSPAVCLVGGFVLSKQVGGLGDVVTALGRAVQDEGHLVEVILPR